MIGKKKYQPFFFACVILVISFCTYFWNYWQPAQLFWDENYHIASAEKYLNNVMFMESHAPLGKMVIALGEWIIHPNSKIDKTSFLATDYLKEIPKGYSFVGVRLFPVLFGMLSALLFFDIIRRIIQKPFLAFLLSSLYVFDNALIVHSRGAMLESTLIFFILLGVDYFLILLHAKKIQTTNWIWLGMIVGCAISVQWMGVVLFVLYPFLFIYHQVNILKMEDKLIDFVFFGLMFLLGVCIVWISLFYLHFRLGTIIYANRSYEASNQYKKIIYDKQTANIRSFPLMLTDYLRYVRTYNAGIPRADMCKYPDENGTSPWGWPFGNKSINYRWEKDNNFVRYLYLIGNPVVWFVGLLGLIIGCVYVIGRILYRFAHSDKKISVIIYTLISLYLLYMGMMVYLESKRAFYAYHYLPALVISLILAVALYTERTIQHPQKKIKPVFFCFLLAITVIAIYYFFSPFTYYLPLTTQQFQLRNWFSWWRLQPIL